MLKAYDAGRLFGARTGDGSPWAVALHGWCRSHRDFDAVLGSSPSPGAGEGGLGAGAGPVDAVAFDLPGWGATPAPPAAWGSVDYADALVPVLSELAEELGGPMVVLGHSFGGRVAVHLAANRPELVKALVLSGAPLMKVGTEARRPALGFRMGKTLHRWGLLGEQRMEELRQRYGSTDYRRATGVMREVFVRAVNEDYEEPLGALAGPVELVWGAEDTEVPLVVAEKVAALLGDRARLTICAGVGHLTPLEAPVALRSAIERHRHR